MSFGHVMRSNGLDKEYDAGIRRGKKKKRLSDEEVDGGNTHDVKNLAELRDAVEDRDLWRKLTMTIAR